MEFRGKLGRLGIAALALATIAGGSLFASSTAHAQAPSSVPAARFYGNVRINGGQPITNWTITAAVGSTVCSGTQSIPGSQTNSGTTNNGTYALDIQSVPGCTQPGSTVVFTASSGASGTFRAQQTGTIPDIPGTAVHLDLTFNAPTPTPTPTRAATPVATPPPVATTVRPPVTTATPPPVATTVRPPASPTVQRPTVQGPKAVQAPKGPVTAQAPKSAPVYQAPRAAGGGAVAPVATAPRLPSTGTGGLLDQPASPSLTGWALALIVLAALGVSATGLMAYRRSH